MSRPITHYFFILLSLIFIGLLMFSAIPFPILIGLFLISWCGLALLVMLYQRIKDNGNS